MLLRSSPRSGLLEFTRYTFPRFEFNWHHTAICKFIDRWVAGDFDRGMIFMPPRHAKSEFISRRLPAYLLGRFPDDFVIACSYGGDLAGTMGRDVQRIMDGPKYQNLFPETRLPTRQDKGYKRVEDFFELPGHKGHYRSSGIGKGITGFGMHWGVIDDPIKSRQEAGSAAFRRRLQGWYQDDFYSRNQGGAKILITCTRWDSDDLAGWLLQRAQEETGADQWEVLSLPAICEQTGNPYDIRKPGEALHEKRFPLSEMLRRKATTDERGWLSLWQQRPTAGSGISGAYYAFSAANIKQCVYNPVFPIHWSLDFNVNPMCSVIAQVETRTSQQLWMTDYGWAGDRIKVTEEICLPNSNTPQMCKAFEEIILKRYSMPRPITVYIHGDSTSNSRDTRGNVSDWTIVRSYFAGHPHIKPVYRVGKSNPAVMDRVASVNALLRSADGTQRLFVDQKCRELIKDFEKVRRKQDLAGNSLDDLDKSDPARSHISDALGYLVWDEFPLAPIGGPRSSVIA